MRHKVKAGHVAGGAPAGLRWQDAACPDLPVPGRLPRIPLQVCEPWVGRRSRPALRRRVGDNVVVADSNAYCAAPHTGARGHRRPPVAERAHRRLRRRPCHETPAIDFGPEPAALRERRMGTVGQATACASRRVRASVRTSDLVAAPSASFRIYLIRVRVGSAEGRGQRGEARRHVRGRHHRLPGSRRVGWPRPGALRHRSSLPPPGASDGRPSADSGLYAPKKE